jgi:hypothetical protein
VKDRLARHFVQPGELLRQPGTPLRQPGTPLRQPGPNNHPLIVTPLLIVDITFLQLELQQCHNDDDNKQHK